MNDWMRACVVSDSQSVLVCLKGSRGGLCEGLIARCAWVLSELCQLERYICMVWVPGHSAIAENELADAVAARSCSLMQNDVACLRTSVRFCLKRLLDRGAWMHDRCKEVYDGCINVGLENTPSPLVDHFNHFLP